MKKHKKIAWIVGCRPNFVKTFKHENQVIIHTGQHYDKNLSADFFKKLKMRKPKYNLGCKTPGETFDALIPVLKQEKPDYVMIIGDTSSSLMEALAAAYCRIPIIHLEAGVRSYNTGMPEEINRILIDRISDIYLCPSETAVNTLQREGIVYNLYNVGSNVLDGVIKECPTKEVKGYKKNEYRVMTLHRQSNVDNKENLKTILDAVEESGEKFVWPMHPRARKMIEKFKLKVPENIEVIEPIDHKKMIHLMAFAKQILTDSGGMQVEAYFLRKPCVTVRNETEWIETVEEKWNVLTGVNKRNIVLAIKNHLPRAIQHSNNSYGKGNSNELIKNLLETL